jgi:hypothetical protein
MSTYVRTMYVVCNSIHISRVDKQRERGKDVHPSALC